MTDLKAREKQLKERLAELDGRLHRIEDHLEQPPENDWEDRATDLEMDDVLQSLGTAGMVEVEAIHAALGRIESGAYGVCLRCGEKIMEERLDIVPHTTLCRKCAREVAAQKR
jgi:RNA polymerase-binding transcription factor DksA